MDGIPYTLQWAAPFPSKLPLAMVGSRPTSNTWFLGPTRVHSRKGISIGSAFLAGLTVAADRQTMLLHLFRPHLCT